MTGNPLQRTEDWLQKEAYASLRREVEHCMAELGTLERTVVGGVALLFAWAAKESGTVPHLAFIVWLTPTVLALYGGLKAKAIATHLKVLGGYLNEIEQSQLSRGEAAIEGWQNYFDRNSPAERTTLMAAAWIGFIILTLLTGVIGFVQFI